ncbi:MAG: hypothetical protein AAF483_22010 [Planctomycetota bacterium]
MNVSIDEIRALREILNQHRLEHEKMVTRMQLLRDKSRQMRLNAIRLQSENLGSSGALQEFESSRFTVCID